MTKLHGNMPVKLDDFQNWGKHDHGANWNDGGQVRRALDALAVDLEKIIADESKAAVLDYASNAEVGLGVDTNGELLVGVRLYNDDAQIKVKVPFRQLVLEAINQIKPSIGTDPSSQALLSAMISVGRQLASIMQPAPPPRAVPGHNSGSVQAMQAGIAPRRPVRNPPPVAGA